MSTLLKIAAIGLASVWAIPWGSGVAQELGSGTRTADPAVKTSSSADGDPTSRPAYELGPYDLLSVSVYGVPELTSSVRVAPDGTIQLPVVGPLVAEGKTPTALSRDIATALANGLVLNPQVTVQVAEYRAHQILVLGQVQAPGPFSLTQSTSVVEAIALAGGLTPNAADEVIVKRRGREILANGASAPPAEVLRVDISGVLGKGDVDGNFEVVDGDVIHVPERERQVFYVVGAVNAPGVYELPKSHRDNPFSVTQALSQAGGASQTAKMKNGRVLRFDAKGPRRDLEVNFKKVILGEAEDLAVRPYDVLFVPSSNIKSIGYAMMGIVPGTISATVVNSTR